MPTTPLGSNVGPKLRTNRSPETERSSRLQQPFKTCGQNTAYAPAAIRADRRDLAVMLARPRPIIPVPRSLLEALKRAHSRASCNFVIAYRGAKVADVKTGFKSAAERAGIPECTSHTLRHTAGTWMAQRGVPLRQITGYLGHSEQRTTELYAHHHPAFLADARQAFERRR